MCYLFPFFGTDSHCSFVFSLDLNWLQKLHLKKRLTYLKKSLDQPQKQRYVIPIANNNNINNNNNNSN